MFLTTFIKDVELIPGEIAAFFSSHQTRIHSAIADAQTAAAAGIAIATALGQPEIAAAIAGVSDGLTKVSSAVTSASTATTLGAQAANVAELANSLIASGDIGVKSTATQASLTNTVDTVVAKANTVIGALITAATAVATLPPAPTAAALPAAA